MNIKTDAEWSRLVSRRTGVVRSLRRFAPPHTEPPIPVIWQAELAHVQVGAGGDLDRFGAGKGLTDEDAILGAIGEALERYCGSLLLRDRLIVAPFSQLGDEAIHPAEFVLFTEDQYDDPSFPYKRFDDDAETTWIRAVDFDTGGEVLVPAAMTYLSFSRSLSNDRSLPTTSNGLASGLSLTQACFAGLCELIERDAFLITWMNRLHARRVRMNVAGPETEVERHYGRFGVELVAFDITSDIGVPVVMAVAIDHSGNGPALTTGLGCHPDVSIALRKAVFEVCQVRPGDIERWRSGAGDRLREYSDVRDMEDHSAFFYSPSRLGELDFLLEDGGGMLPASGQSEDGEVDFGGVWSKVNATGARVFMVDLTTSDVESSGFRVVRILATELVPLQFGHGLMCLGGSRLRRSLAVSHEEVTRGGLNPCPHPIA